MTESSVQPSRTLSHPRLRRCAHTSSKACISARKACFDIIVDNAHDLRLVVLVGKDRLQPLGLKRLLEHARTARSVRSHNANHLFALAGK